MGMGEPLLNFRNTVSSAEMFLNKYNIREITLSTSGIFPKMRDLFAADLPIRIAVSVHATRPHVRERLMPVEKFFPIRDVLRECESYTSVNGHSLILEYLMLQGMNDSMEDFLDFIETTKNVSKEIHVIPFNESRFIPFRRSKKEVIKTFVDMLRAKGIRAYVKESYGQDVGAGCGQLFSEDAALIRFADAPERCGPPSS
jgi:23S rRNA (adenine2503-C2)-methyltransferase